MVDITLPHNYTPRWYQLPAWRALDAGYKRLLLIRHRRAGKDKDCVNMMARAMLQRVGSYFYFFPTFAQGRRVIWDGMDGSGYRFMNHIPRELWDGDPNHTDMRIRLTNGSIFQVVGSDKIDNVIGTNPVGCVFSEFSLEDPRGWEFVRPILRENGGWAIFNGTPRGRANHMYKLYEMAQTNDAWYVEKLGVDYTKVMSEADIQEERDSGMEEELVQQEFYCSFDGGMQGSFYTDQMTALEARGGVTDVPFDPLLKVNTAWDIGMDDETAIIFFQLSPAGQIRIIDFYIDSGKGLEHYITETFTRARENEWVYGEHIAPWDMAVRELGTGKSRREVAQSMGINFKISRKLPVDEGINAVRMMLPLVWFNRDTTEHLRNALWSYRKRMDSSTREFTGSPVHDWASHPADAMRYLAIGRRNADLPDREDRYARPRPYGGRRQAATSWMAG